jgi:hypothetical protein
MSKRVAKKLVKKRRKAAEEVCWRILLMMGLDILPIEDYDSRKLLADPMEKWADLAQQTGQFPNKGT